MIPTIVGFVNNYKYELIGGTWGYLLAYKEKNLRWGRYAKTITTHPLYAFMGIGIGYTLKNIHIHNFIPNFFSEIFS